METFKIFTKETDQGELYWIAGCKSRNWPAKVKIDLTLVSVVVPRRQVKEKC